MLGLVCPCSLSTESLFMKATHWITMGGIMPWGSGSMCVWVHVCVWVSVGVWVGVWVGVCGWVSRCGVWGVASMFSNTRWNCGGWIGECHVYYTVVGVHCLYLASFPGHVEVWKLAWYLSFLHAWTVLLNYRRLWLFSACTYKLRLQETMHLTDNVRLTSGIIVAMPSMRKHVIAKRVIVNVEHVNKRQERRRWQAPQCQMTLFFFTKVWCEATIFSKGCGLQEQKRLYKFDKKQETPHNRNAVALLKADGTVVGHVHSSFLLGSLGQQSLLAFCFARSDRHFSHTL